MYHIIITNQAGILYILHCEPQGFSIFCLSNKIKFIRVEGFNTPPFRAGLLISEENYAGS